MQKNKKYILIIGLLMITLVKFVIRPYIFIPQAFFLYRDVAPNLISAFLIPFGADIFFGKWLILVKKRDVLFICMIGLTVITINEIAQLFPFFRRTFDYFDLLFSIIGVGFGYLVYTKYFLCSSTEKASSN